MSYRKILLAGGLILVTSFFIFNFAQKTEAGIVSGDTSGTIGTVNLPQCPFSDSAGIYVKNVLCGWANERCEINTTIPNNNNRESSNCRHMCWGINKIATGEQGGVVAATLPSFPDGTRLCTTTSDPAQVNIPVCPFQGEIGDVWVKPVNIPWDPQEVSAEVSGVSAEIAEGRCKVGTDCDKQPFSIGLGSIDIFGFQIDAGGSLNIKTRSDIPGAVYAHSQATALPLVWAYNICIVRITSSNQTPSPSPTPDPSPSQNTLATGTITVSPSTVQAGQPFTVTVTGIDPDGMQYVGIKEDNKDAQWSAKGSGSEFSKQWTVTEDQAGTYTFAGYVNGTDPTLTDAYKIEVAKTTPEQISVTVTASGTTSDPSQNTLATGTITVSPSTVQAGQPFTVTVTGIDPDGMQYVGIKEDNKDAQWSAKGSGSEFSKQWTVTEDQAGTYTFAGYVNGTDPTLTDAYKIEVAKTTPEQISVTVTASGTGSLNTPASGTMTVYPSTTALVGQPFIITVTGKDTDGIQWVGMREGTGSVQRSAKGSGPEFSEQWTITKGKVGTYTFYGYVDGTNPDLTDDYKVENIKTDPEQISVNIVISIPETQDPDNSGGGSSGSTGGTGCSCGDSTGQPSTGTPDTGTPSTGTPDTETPDTGTPDTETPSDEPTINLPLCSFPSVANIPALEGKNAIWAKNTNCNWADKCPLGYSCNSSCGLLNFYHLDTRGTNHYGVQSLNFLAFANSFDLCMQGDATDFSVGPPCPFAGEQGDVWVSPDPAGGSLVSWDVRSKLGSDSSQSSNPFTVISDLQKLVDQAQDLGMTFEFDDPGVAQMLDKSLDNVGIEIDIDSFTDLLGLTKYLEKIGTVLSNIKIPNAGFYIKTYADKPGRVDSYIDNGGFPLKLASPVKMCIVGGTGEGNTFTVPGGQVSKPSGKTNPAEDIGDTQAVLGGRLQDKGGDISPLVIIEWGTTSQYGESEETFYSSAKTSIWGDWEIPIQGLEPGTTYHFRTAVSNNAGTTYGEDLTFTTASVAGGTGTTGPGDTGSTSGGTGSTGTGSTGTGSTGSTGTGSTGSTGTGSTGSTGTGSTGTGSTGSAGTGGCGSATGVTGPQTKASVSTTSASQVANHSVTLSGNVTDLGNCWPSRASVFFQWGTTSKYGQSQFVKAADRTGSFTLPLTNLTPGTTYHFRATASNCEGTTYGEDLTFTTTGENIPGAAENAIAVTQNITNITSNSATLSGQVSSLGNWSWGMVYFEWKRANVDCGANNNLIGVTYNPQSFTFNLVNLLPSTPYKIRIKVSGSHPGEWTYGQYVTFTTQSK